MSHDRDTSHKPDEGDPQPEDASLEDSQHEGQDPPADEDQPASEGERTIADVTRPTAPYRVSEAGGPLPELDEGPRPTAVDDIQQAIFDAGQQGTSSQLSFDELPTPGLDLSEIDSPPAEPNPEPEPSDDIQQAILTAQQQGGSLEIDFEELPEPQTAPKKKISPTTKPMPPVHPVPPHPPESAPAPEPTQP